MVNNTPREAENWLVDEIKKDKGALSYKTWVVYEERSHIFLECMMLGELQKINRQQPLSDFAYTQEPAKRIRDFLCGASNVKDQLPKVDMYQNCFTTGVLKHSYNNPTNFMMNENLKNLIIQSSTKV